MLERKVWTLGGAGPIYANLFTLLVGPPASGKSNAIRPIRDLWSKVQGLHLSPDNLTKASLIDALASATRTVINGEDSAHIFSALVVPCSELGVFISHNDLEFLSVLTHVYDCPDYYSEERRTSGKVEINKPYMTLLAGTQPDFLNSLLPEEAWGQGFTSRLIMVYANTAPKVSLFGDNTFDGRPLQERLTQIFDYKGEFTWTKNAIDEINAWHQAGCPPTPSHPKLLNYNGRRAVHTLKLAMISSASRNGKLEVCVEDFERAKDWLLTTENVMPDIFRAMGQRSDVQVLADLHFHLYRIWSSVALDKRKPIAEQLIYEFLHSRVPSERIPRLIETAERAGYLRRAFIPGEWIPNTLTQVGKVG